MTKQEQEKKIKELKKGFKKDINDYIREVERNRVKHSRLEWLMVERFKKGKSEEYKFSWDEALAPLVWINVYMKFPSGKFQGKPMRLQPWQSFIVSQLFGWYDEKGGRRYRNAYIEISRKNGKSTFIGALCAYMAFSKKENDGSPCYVGATTLDQAGEVFTRISQGLKHHKDIQIQDSKNNKMIIWKGGRIIGISGEPKDGKLSHFAVIDEYHQHKTDKLVKSIQSGNVADPRSLLVLITTAGTDLYGVCKREHDKAIEILENDNNDNYFSAIFTCDRDDDITKVESWIKANPNWGISIDEKSFRIQYENAKNSASEMIDFKTKNLNVWVSGLDRWADMDKWNNLCNVPFNEDIFEGGVCYAGLDLSTVKDFTAFTIDRYVEGVHYLKSWYFIPQGQIASLEYSLRVPLVQWIMSGYIIATSGDVINYTEVAEKIKEVKEKYNVELIAADRWRLQSLVPLMPPWFEDIAFEFSQALKTMSPCIKEFERLYMSGKIQANNDPVLRWMMSSAEVKVTGLGDVRLDKPTKENVRSSRIDGVITSIMAVDTAKTHSEESESNNFLQYDDISELIGVI